MENTSLAIALSALDFLNLPEKLRLYREAQKIGGLGDNDFLSFLEKSSFDQIIRLSKRDVRRPLCIKRWAPAELVRLAKKSALLSRAFGSSCVLFGESLYPSLLREISDPPFALFYRGKIQVLASQCVSVVGTRRLCSKAKKAARDFAREAALDGLCVVSGLAMGADGQAHQGALDAFYDNKIPFCQTAAVLAGGVDNIFPSAHKKMAAQIMQNGGLILSESAPGICGEKWRFVRRNRIIAGLSPATVVIQAPPGSGAMITADFALDYNRELFFHQTCFCKEAMELSDYVFKSLQAKKGWQFEKKIQARPEKYVQDGAKIILDYQDYRQNMKIS